MFIAFFIGFFQYQLYLYYMEERGEKEWQTTFR